MKRLRSNAFLDTATARTFATLALGLITVLAILPATSSAELIGDPGLLEKAATLYRENLDRLKTWQGSVDYVHKVSVGREPGTFSVIETRNSFACSRTEGMLRFNIDVVKDDLLTGDRRGRRFPGMGQEHLAGLSRDGEHYYIVYRDGSDRRATVSSKPRRHPDCGSWGVDSYVVFDPLYYCTNRGQVLDEYWRFLLKEAINPELKAIVSLDKSLVTLNDFDGDFITVFDLDQGANLVLQTITQRDTEAVSTSSYKWQWHQVGGVFVPRSFEYAHIDSGSPPRNVERKLTWTTSVVNEPIEESEFDLPRIGLRAEDHLYDDRDRTSERSLELLRSPRPERPRFPRR